MLDISLLKNKAIVVLGAGISGLSCARFLYNNGIQFSLNDSRTNPIDKLTFEQEFPNNELFLGAWNKSLINAADIVLVSPGINLNDPEISTAINDESEVFGDVELYCRLTDTPTIAVTGSNGKSTVVTLLAYLGNALGYKTQLGGNIGVPVLDTIHDHPDFLILELSSFQLETITNLQALSATVLNICDDHLDRHITLDNYQRIKQDIYRQAQVAVINRDDDKTYLPTILADKTISSFGLNKPNSDSEFGLAMIDGKEYLMQGHTSLIAVEQLPIAGTHNALNCLAALALGKAAGWSVTNMVKALPNFIGLEHRCQIIESHDGIHWVNDSKATNVGATLAAINGFVNKKSAANKLYLIAGGDGKGADFSELKVPVEEHICQMFVFGKDKKKLQQLSSKSCVVDDLQAAVYQASQVAVAGDIVLLSPACASIDMFKNYMERGIAFEKAVVEVQSC